MVLQFPETRCNGAWMQGDCLVPRLQTHKNRPKGSILTRKCSCARMVGPRFCAYHRFGASTTSSMVDQSLWHFPDQRTPLLLRSSLNFHRNKRCQEYDLKNIQSGTRNLNGSCRGPCKEDHGVWGLALEGSLVLHRRVTRRCEQSPA